MNIQEFFQQSAGKWVSQRTSHQLLQNQTENAKSELTVEMVPLDQPSVAQFCQQQQLDPQQVLCAVKMSWSSTVEHNPKPQVGASLLLIVPDANPDQGRLLRQSGSETIAGRYLMDMMGEDEVLTLITEQGDFYAEERLWFANPNFRLRTSAIKQAGSYQLAAFCSEIRMGGAPAAAKPAAAEASG